MKQIILNTSYEEDKIDAIRQFTTDKKPSLESEIPSLIDRLCRKNVPASVRECIAAKADAPAPVGSDRRKNRAKSASNTAQNDAHSQTEDDGGI